MDNIFDDVLNRDTINLVMGAHVGAISAPLFRDGIIEQALTLLRRRRSVLIVGPEGVGKTAIIHGIAARLAAGLPENFEEEGFPEDFAGPVWINEISTSGLMSRTRYLGEWQTKLTALVENSYSAGSVVYFSDIWHLPTVGKTDSSPDNALDALRTPVQQKRVVLLGEVTPTQLRHLERTPGFSSLFEKVLVPPLEPEQALQVISNHAETLELDLDERSRKRLIRLPERFSPSRPAPGGAIALAEHVRDYREQKTAIGEEEPITPAFIEKVFSIYSGLPLFVVSEEARKPAGEIRAWFEDRLVGQRRAIEAVLESIALFKAGLTDPSRPIGSFLFVGPTGVGKTELARLLATFLFGSPNRMLRFDLSEFSDYLAVERLVGSAHDETRPAPLIDPVRANPFQVILLDELEKAHASVWDLLLPLLDEGRLTPPRGATVNFRNTIIICTSNVGAATSDRSLGFGAAPENAQRQDRVREALEAAFRPEFLNRFQHTVVFDALDRGQVTLVARQELRRILKREGIVGRNLVVDVDDTAFDLVIEKGFDPRYGARSLKREIQTRLVMPLAMTIMEKSPTPGSLLQVHARGGRIQVRIVDTPESRVEDALKQPVRVEAGIKLTRDDIAAKLEEYGAAVDALARELDVKGLEKTRTRLELHRNQPGFFRDSEYTSQILLELDQVNGVIDRMTRLDDRRQRLEARLTEADSRHKIQQLGRDVCSLEPAIERHRRELLVMGFEGQRDAIVEIMPVGPDDEAARQLLVETYARWAKQKNLSIDWLCVPRSTDDPVIWALRGRYAFGLLRGESGLHRVRRQKEHWTARVKVLPWLDDKAEGPIDYVEHRALKGVGHGDRKLRSRLTAAGGLILQNEHTLVENQELARQLLPSWTGAETEISEVVRRYDLEPTKIRDVATDFSTGRSDALQADGFHELLLMRVDALYSATGASGS